MKVTFLGAVREVTGSMHMVSCENEHILLDCGMFQGRRKEAEEKNKILPVDPETIRNVVLSHAHIDHTGRIPFLTKERFSGKIICTRPTADASHFLLLDSAHIQESDSLYLNYKKLRNHLNELEKTSGVANKEKKKAKEEKNSLKSDGHRISFNRVMELLNKYGIDPVRPLYTTPDAQNALSFFEPYPYRHEVTVGKNMTATLYEAGHILGSAVCMIRATDRGRPKTICYTGDIGRFSKPIIRDPNLSFLPEHQDVDILIMESTYGNRVHAPIFDMKESLEKHLVKTYERGGTVLIPSFAFGRTQEIIYVLHELYNEGKTPKLPIFIDSPLATNLTRVFGEHPETYDRETHASFLEHGENPFMFKEVNYISGVEDSMELMRRDSPHIVIASSGMCEAGRILHHLRYKIHNPKNTILIVGYMAQNTLGRRIQELGTEYKASGYSGKPPEVKFLNKIYPLKAEVCVLGGFSAHGDRDEMVTFLENSNLRVKEIALVHGEESQSLAFSEHLRDKGYRVFVPSPGQSAHV